MLYRLNSKRRRVIGFGDIPDIVACLGIAYGQVKGLPFFIPAVKALFHEADNWSFLSLYPGGTDNQGQFTGVKLQQGADRVYTQHVNKNFYEDGVEILTSTFKHEAQSAVGAQNGFPVYPW